MLSAAVVVELSGIKLQKHELKNQLKITFICCLEWLSLI